MTPNEQPKAPLRRMTLEDVDQIADIKPEILDIPEWGVSVLVRGLSREEVAAATENAARIPDPDSKDPNATKPDPFSVEDHYIAAAVVEPKMTTEQAAKLRKGVAGGSARLALHVVKISGIGKEALVAAERSFPGAGEGPLPVLAGEAARPDGGGTGEDHQPA